MFDCGRSTCKIDPPPFLLNIPGTYVVKSNMTQFPVIPRTNRTIIQPLSESHELSTFCTYSESYHAFPIEPVGLSSTGKWQRLGSPLIDFALALSRSVCHLMQSHHLADAIIIISIIIIDSPNCSRCTSS